MTAGLNLLAGTPALLLSRPPRVGGAMAPGSSRSVNHYMRAIDMAAAGDYTALIARGTAVGDRNQSAAAPPARPPEVDALPQVHGQIAVGSANHLRFVKMADLGNISGAKSSLGPRPPPVPQTDVNKATVAELHPRRPEPLPLDLSGLLHGCPALNVTSADVQAALRKSGSGKAPGPTGLTNDHIKQLVGYGEKVDLPMLHALTGFINLFLGGGYVGFPAADWLSSASFHSFVKTKADGTPQAPRPNGGDPLRPLGINDTWTNVACRSVMTDDLRGRLRRFFEQLGQFGVGTPAGCPAVVLAVQAWLTDPDNAVFQSDLVNAFTIPSIASSLSAPCASTSPSSIRPCTPSLRATTCCSGAHASLVPTLYTSSPARWAASRGASGPACSTHSRS
jgi:hypothetical protein